MKKIYIVEYGWYDARLIKGVFDDRELAESALQSLQAVEQNDPHTKKSLDHFGEETRFFIKEGDINTLYRFDFGED